MHPAHDVRPRSKRGAAPPFHGTEGSLDRIRPQVSVLDRAALDTREASRRAHDRARVTWIFANARIADVEMMIDTMCDVSYVTFRLVL